LGQQEGEAKAALSTPSRPAVQRIDPLISFSWPSGIIIPGLASATEAVASDGASPSGLSVGQSVLWEGYLTTPRTDAFSLTLKAEHISGLIYLDGELVFDSSSGVQVALLLRDDAAYALRVEASVAPQAFNRPVSLKLVWSTPTVKQHAVPRFFLYSGAADVAFSPFNVAVNAPATT
jgi:hypothetical protein